MVDGKRPDSEQRVEELATAVSETREVPPCLPVLEVNVDLLEG
jgi:hypothetical protein